jgi:serine/threonine kinase 16
MRRSSNNKPPPQRINNKHNSHHHPTNTATVAHSTTLSILRVPIELLRKMISAIMAVTILAFVTWLFRELKSFWQRHMGPKIIFTDTETDGNGMITVRLGRQIAEGGFSVVFECTAADVNNNNSSSRSNTTSSLHKKKKRNNNNNQKQKAKHATTTKYALKRIICADSEILHACQAEADVHRAVHHANLMPLLGMTIDSSNASNSGGSLCYMLFPLYQHSLRHEVNKRTLDRPMQSSSSSSSSSTSRSSSSTRLPAPWSELQALQICLQVVSGVQALHAANYSHRDIKLENVLLADNHYNNSNSNSNSNDSRFHPVLMDFGSAGPLQQDITERRHVLMAIENASMHTTLSYRPPELLEAGGVRHGGGGGDDDDMATATLDYRAVDVWSLGCFIFALLYGASPKECEFTSLEQQEQWHRSTNNRQRHHHHHQQQQSPQSCGGGFLQIVECTPLRILNDRLPTPPEHSDAAAWYSADLIQLIAEMLHQDRQQRPTLDHVHVALVGLIQKLGGKPIASSSSSTTTTTPFSNYHDDSDDDNADFINVNVNDDEDEDHEAAAEMSLISHRV